MHFYSVKFSYCVSPTHMMILFGEIVENRSYFPRILGSSAISVYAALYHERASNVHPRCGDSLLPPRPVSHRLLARGSRRRRSPTHRGTLQLSQG